MGPVHLLSLDRLVPKRSPQLAVGTSTSENLRAVTANDLSETGVVNLVTCTAHANGSMPV